MAKDRATSNCAGQLRIIYVCSRSADSDAPNLQDETENIRQTLMMLPPGISYAIPSTDIRRLSVIRLTLFSNTNVFNDGTGPKLVCYMADVREDDEGQQILKDGKGVKEYEISEKSRERLPISENSDEKTEVSDGIVEFINCICESKIQMPSGQCSRLPEENMVGEFIQKLKNNKIYHFSDNEVKVDHLQGKTVAIILIDPYSPECLRLQQIYHDIKLKQSNFEAIWIPLQEEKDLGFGTYSRAIQCMPWLTLDYPKLIKMDGIKDKSGRVIIINSGGTIENPNALSLVMYRGAEAYPFTKGSLTQLDLKSSLEFLFLSTEIKELNNKLIFLYAEHPSQELEMKRTLEKLVQIHGKGNFEIVYVGCFFPEREVSEDATQSLQKAYEYVTESMNWTKLSFFEMMTFWYGCKYLWDEAVQDSKSASTLKRIVEALLDERRWLVVVDGDGMVTANGIDVVQMACESSDDKDEVDIMMQEELRESLKEGKCSERVRAFFRDELNHPLHRHPLRTCKRILITFNCDRCGLECVHVPYGKRRLRCYDCDWDICCDCWKEFVKEEVRRQATQES